MPPVLTTMPRASQSPEILDGQNIASMERDVVDPQDPRKLTRGASQELAAKLKRTASLQQKSKEEDGSKTQRIKGSGRRNKSTKDSSSCLSTEEVARIQACFHFHDTENTKALSVDQFRQLMAIAGSPQTHTQMYSIMVLVDKEGDGCLTESEFVDLFEKVRLGYLSENEELRRALKKICSPVLIGRVSVGGGGAIDNGEDGSARGRPQRNGRISMPGGRVRGSRVRSAKQFFEEKAWAESARIKEESDRIDRKERKLAEMARRAEFREKMKLYQG